MCRIAGIVSTHQTSEDRTHQVKSMCRALAHGGPDDEGIYADSDLNIVLGHRRLSLIDLSPGGHQPMTYRGDDLVITYNGELYNYLELKSDLRTLGFGFVSTSDTEVILAAYAAWGTAAFKRFAGMFAFALLDRKGGNLFLVRDQTGIKPLYYSLANGGLCFASEVRAFLVGEGAPPEADNWQVYFMAYGHLPEPVTTLKGVKPLPKGCYMHYEIRTQRVEFHSYAHLSYVEKIDNWEEALEKIRACLSHAVERHLLSDAPIGAFLSGGIDSSLMALLAGKVVGDKLTTLSIYFGEEQYSEKKYQNLIAQKLGGSHQAFCLGREEFNDNLPGIISSMDLPSNDGINTWFISKYAKEAGLKAVLSGLGGDELFGGYPSFDRIKKAAFLQQLPGSTLKAARYGGSKSLKRLAYLTLPGIKGKYLFLRGQFTPHEIASQLGIAEEQVWSLLEEAPTMPDIHYLTAKNQASWMETTLYMQNQLLRDSDVMSMAHGIEIRVPFLDLDFIKLVLQIQSGIKYEGGGKKTLVAAFGDLLPSEIYNRPKMGFSFPFKEWLAGNNWVKDELTTKGGAGAKIYKEFLQGQRHWSQVLSLLLIQHHGATKKAALSYA